MSVAAAEEGRRTTGELLSWATAVLTRAGVPSARLDAALLLARSLGADRAALLARPERRPTDAQADGFAALLRRRAARVPLSHLLGQREFWSLPFMVNGDVLDPRPDSETLVEAALAAVGAADAALRVLDLGTGSGCLLLALLSELPNAHGIGVDLSQAAIRVARANAAALGLAARARFVVGDWTQAMAARFDLIIANPPYVAEADIAGLEPEVSRHEPRLALRGGRDGLDAYRAIAPDLRRLLRVGGTLAVECGIGQAPAVEAILADSGLHVVGRRRDLSGVDRCIVAEGPEGSE